ncbi:hypothetical protein KCU98_g4807, partial [Aureobasidium melanogenum]
MPYHSHFTLPTADQHDVDTAWFDKQKQRSVEKNDPRLREWLTIEVDALKAYHDGNEDADPTAATMTRSISSSPVLDLDTYSDDILALDIKLDFHIPAISFLFKYNAREIYERVVHGELKDLTPAQLLPGVAKQFEDGAQRWSFWKRRLEELAQGGEGDEVAVAARSALESMILVADA